MTSRRMAHAGILGSAIAAFALFLMGGNRPPQFGDPLPGLTRAELARFQAGKTVFDHDFDAPGGLGPVFNDTSCTNCHNQGGDGGGSDIGELEGEVTRAGGVLTLGAETGDCLISRGTPLDMLPPPEGAVMVLGAVTVALLKPLLPSSFLGEKFLAPVGAPVEIGPPGNGKVRAGPLP